MTDITAIITGHREGLLAGPAVASFLEAVEHARAEGLIVETLVVIDRPDMTSRTFFEAFAKGGHRLILGNNGDPGLTRNQGVSAANGKYVSFLDADDMWSFNWLLEAYRFCEMSQDVIVAHSEVNVVFGAGQQLWFHADSQGSDFIADYQRVGNYWDAMSFGLRTLFLQVPFQKNELSEGFGHEDWHWNNMTLEMGVAHRPVPGTVHFKRRRPGSQMSLVDQSDAFVRPTKISDFKWRLPNPLSKQSLASRIASLEATDVKISHDATPAAPTTRNMPASASISKKNTPPVAKSPPSLAKPPAFEKPRSTTPVTDSGIMPQTSSQPTTSLDDVKRTSSDTGMTTKPANRSGKQNLNNPSGGTDIRLSTPKRKSGTRSVTTPHIKGTDHSSRRN
jgi:glycosyltransferase involved in cell wall biosynthesis